MERGYIMLKILLLYRSSRMPTFIRISANLSPQIAKVACVSQKAKASKTYSFRDATLETEA